MALEQLAAYCKELGTELFVDPKGRGWCIWACRPPHGYLKEMYVVPEARRQGVGLAMAQLIGYMAKEQGCTHLRSNVPIHNVGAMNSIGAHLGGGAVIVEAHGGVVSFEWAIP